MRISVGGPQQSDNPRHLWFWLYYNWKTKKLRVYRLEEWSKLKRDIGIRDEDDAPGGRRLRQEEQIYRCALVLPSYVFGAQNVVGYKDSEMPRHQVLLAEFSSLADICKPFLGPEQTMAEYLSTMVARAVDDVLPPYQYIPHGGGVSSGIIDGTSSYIEFGDPPHRYEITVKDCGEVKSIEERRKDEEKRQKSRKRSKK